MVWDLRGALLKKEERESARLADFEFRHRARTFRLVADALHTEAGPLVALIAKMDDERALAEVKRMYPASASEIEALYERCMRDARAQLISERGNPAPYRLA
jgi:acyl-CoA reductase-like NAD-dependent aldehyde dehydrogenase